jgi:hypothetical protein
MSDAEERARVELILAEYERDKELYGRFCGSVERLLLELLETSTESFTWSETISRSISRIRSINGRPRALINSGISLSILSRYSIAREFFCLSIMSSRASRSRFRSVPSCNMHGRRSNMASVTSDSLECLPQLEDASRVLRVS